MKAKRLAYYLLPLLLMVSPGIGSAEQEPIVEPNQYKEKDIELQTEYFHEESLLEKKRSLPEEQKSLTFMKVEDPYYENARQELFQSSAADNNTIKAKAEQLELFSSEGRMSFGTDKTEKDDGFNFNLTVLLGILAVLAVICLFLILVPKMSKGDFQGAKRQA
ncbi:type VII secretion protein EssA [Peribacillus glennii]|uniref:Type VII secretion protein EssA n=1 Tax=Peribacillus glennii TaxID=2303991 RepID=A0A372LC51_9BACI|nr:type VII secretion protein EssA [Peribacillus glennii]RFU63100.1 type VII secretion protein EssA [Peribacillus glennii]